MNNKRKIPPKIIEFRREDAQKLAELFNSFDKEGLWPGGFTGGLPYTAERVLDSFPVGIRSICILISTHKDKFTGICTVHPHYEDAEAAYVGVLGVHPKYLGQGHGKALLLKALQEASKRNLRRVDLNTWAGNMRAVPLYKKCGMFWVPETSVAMEDYIPGILSLPYAREFFKKHDWYASQKRTLQLAPDAYKIGEMEVYPYEFSEGDDHLKVWVDRYGKGISGIEQTIAGRHLRITCRLENHKVITGLPQVLTIEVQNDTNILLDGSMFLTAFEGLSFTTNTQQAFRVQHNTSTTLTAQFTVTADIEVPETSRKQKSIQINLIVNGKLLPLEVGLRILPLLKFTTHPENITVSPGTTGTLRINAFNNAQDTFKGEIFLQDENNNLTLTTTRVPVEIPGKSHYGCPIDLSINKTQPTSVLPLRLFGRGKVNDVSIETKTNTIYAKCLKPGGIVAALEKTELGNAFIIETDNLSAKIQLRGARLTLTYKNGQYGKRQILNQSEIRVGPPFGFVRPIEYDYKIHQTPETLQLSLSRMHQDKAGLKMIRILTFYKGTPLIKDQARIVNENPDITYEPNLRISGRAGLERFNYTMIVPLDEIMEHHMIEFPVSDSDLPQEPDKYSESWIAFQNLDEGFCFGQIWSKKNLTKIRIGEQSLFHPEYALGEIKPGESACTSDLYYLVEKGDWQTIRRRWQSLIEKKTLDPKDEVVPATPLFNVKLAETLLYDNTEKITKLRIVNSRSKEVTGEITVKPPKGWSVNPSQISIKDVSAKSPFTCDLSVIPPSNAELGLHQGTIRLVTDGQYIQFPLNLCLLSKQAESKVLITKVTEAEKTVYEISNGFLRFKASAEFAGCLYFLGKDDENQLDTSFPNIGTKVFLENYCGGVRALYMGESFDFQKSKTHEELYKTQLVKEGFWKGVKFSYQSQHQEEIKGTLGSITYLTLPYSNIIKIKRRFENPTSASFRFGNFIWISPKVGGDFKRNEAVFPRGNKIFTFKRHEGVAASEIQREQGWMLVQNRKKKLGLAIIAGNREKSTLVSIDLGNTMLEPFVMSNIQLQPGKSLQLEDYIALTNADCKPLASIAATLRTENRS